MPSLLAQFSRYNIVSALLGLEVSPLISMRNWTLSASEPGVFAASNVGTIEWHLTLQVSPSDTVKVAS